MAVWRGSLGPELGPLEIGRDVDIYWKSRCKCGIMYGKFHVLCQLGVSGPDVDPSKALKCITKVYVGPALVSGHRDHSRRELEGQKRNLEDS